MVPDHRANPDFPASPRQISHTVPLRALADAYQAHAGALVYHTHGIGEPLRSEQVAAHALADLATSHALASRVLAGRWCAVRDALAAGATIAAVATAMELDADEVAAGLRSWAEGQRRYSMDSWASPSMSGCWGC